MPPTDKDRNQDKSSTSKTPDPNARDLPNREGGTDKDEDVKGGRMKLRTD